MKRHQCKEQHESPQDKKICRSRQVFRPDVKEDPRSKGNHPEEKHEADEYLCDDSNYFRLPLCLLLILIFYASARQVVKFGL